MAAKKSTKDDFIGLRFDSKEKAALEKEGLEKGLDLTSYVRFLLKTHPDRAHNKGVGKKPR